MTNTAAATIKEVMSQYDQKRAEWIAARGDEEGFSQWFSYQVVRESLMNSEYGCNNCLWNCIECKAGSNYQIKANYKGQATCGNYTYYD